MSKTLTHKLVFRFSIGQLHYIKENYQAKDIGLLDMVGGPNGICSIINLKYASMRIKV